MSRHQIAIRLLFTLLFLPITAICNVLIVLTTLFQFALLFITLKHSEPVRAFANRVISYALPGVALHLPQQQPAALSLCRVPGGPGAPGGGSQVRGLQLREKGRIATQLP